MIIIKSEKRINPILKYKCPECGNDNNNNNS